MININNVYNTTLTLLNKEQRGYVTPDEFNHIAGIVQNEVFEGYFQKAAIPDNMDSELSNIGEQSKEKLMPFIATTLLTGEGQTEYKPIQVNDFYRALDFYALYEGQTIPIKADRTNTMMANKIMLSPLTRPTVQNPIIILQDNVPGTGDNIENSYLGYQIFPDNYLRLDMEYIRRPNAPNWVGGTLDGQIVPNITDEAYQNFELHESDYSEVVSRVLGYFGLNVRDPEVTQIAGIKQQENNAI